MISEPVFCSIVNQVTVQLCQFIIWGVLNSQSLFVYRNLWAQPSFQTKISAIWKLYLQKCFKACSKQHNLNQKAGMIFIASQWKTVGKKTTLHKLVARSAIITPQWNCSCHNLEVVVNCFCLVVVLCYIALGSGWCFCAPVSVCCAARHHTAIGSVKLRLTSFPELHI